jgi:hypothetical protein
MYFGKRSNLLHTYNAGVVVVNSKVVGLAPGLTITIGLTNVGKF